MALCLRLLLLILLVGSASQAQTQNVLHLGTTTSIRDSGLLDEIQSAFFKRHHIVLRTLVAGSEQVLSAARRGDLDIVLTHSPNAEATFVAEGFGLQRKPVFYSHFLLVGPKGNEAGLNSQEDLEKKLRAIIQTGLPFISRDDLSGTHMLEKGILDKLQLKPEGKSYIKSGRGMGATLQLADQLQAHTLTDTGTWHNLQSRLSLKVLAGEDRETVNQYSLIALNPERLPHSPDAGAAVFDQWLSGAEGQRVINQFRLNEQQVFHSGVAKKES